MVQIMTRSNISQIIIITIITLCFFGCDNLFDVQNPNFIKESQLQDPELIEPLSHTAQGTLSAIYGEVVEAGEMPGDGIMSAQTSASRQHLVDFGFYKDSYSYLATLWDDLSSTRWAAANATQRLIKLVKNPKSNIKVARSHFWLGIDMITEADMFRKIPFDGGKPQTPLEVYKDATKVLKKAAETAKAYTAKTGGKREGVTYIAASYATLARTYRSIYFEKGGDDISVFSKAAKYAKMSLKTDSKLNLKIIISPPGSENLIYDDVNRGNYFGIVPSYVKLKDPVSGKLDPRIKTGDQKGVSNLAGNFKLFVELKYPSLGSDFPISRWQEPELILAEYDLLKNNLKSSVTHINKVRSATGLSPFHSNDPQRIKKQIIYARKAEFWLEFRRWQDMRYYNIIPKRWKPVAVKLGIDRRFPVSVREKSANPNM